ncbi:thioredoxin-disulfide reductase [Candidatus Saccharibacteria bacterium]|nr:thioredoxin-disulfide reductase [Candidatus Saccharibacteria bacterium]
MYDIIIVGAGPAGLTAALYGLRAGKKVLVLDGKAYGGQIINAEKIQNYPGIKEISGRELSKVMLDQVKSLGADTKIEKVLSISQDDNCKIVSTDMGEQYQGKSVILATGAENRKLGLDREQELTGRGISYCATCDGNFYRDKVVAVVGGGNTALMDALYLSSLAKKVYLVHRRDEFRAEHIYVEEAKTKDNIEFELNAIPAKIIGDNKVEGVELQYKNGLPNKVIDVDGLFIAVGYQPQNQEFKNFVQLDENGYIFTEDGVHTTVHGVYVAGDARAKELKQLTTAVGDGANAATAAINEME